MTRAVKAGLISAGVLVASVAQAAVPAEVTTAIADAQADGVTVAIGFTVAALLIKGIHLLRRG